jgi:predicted dehydrogenase
MGVAQRGRTVTLSAVVDPSPAAVETAAKAGVPLYKSLDELFEKDRPDGVVLATPNKLHVEHSVKCIEAGVAQLLEKPIASTVAEGEELVKIVERKVARVLIGHHRAHSPIMAKAKQVIDSGVLGRLVGVMGSATFLKPDHYFEDAPWRKQAGSGPILLNMIHEVHNLRMLCGDIAAVQAFASHAVREFPVEDTVAISLRFANGALGTFLLSDTAACPRSWEQTSQENKATRLRGRDCYVITGTNGCLSIPTMRIKTYPRKEDRSWWKPFESASSDGPRRSAGAPDRAFRRGDPRRGEADRQRARRLEEPAHHRSDRRGSADRQGRRDRIGRKCAAPSPPFRSRANYQGYGRQCDGAARRAGSWRATVEQGKQND